MYADRDNNGRPVAGHDREDFFGDGTESSQDANTGGGFSKLSHGPGNKARYTAGRYGNRLCWWRPFFGLLTSPGCSRVSRYYGDGWKLNKLIKEKALINKYRQQYKNPTAGKENQLCK